MPKLKDARRERFAVEYVKTGVMEQSAITAGYSRNYAKSQSYKLLDNIGIQKRIAELTHASDNAKIASVNEVLEFYAAVLRGEVVEETLIGTGNGEQAITEIKANTAQRLKAADALSKRYGLNLPDNEVNTKPIEIVISRKS